MNLDVSTVDKIPSRSELRPEIESAPFRRTALTPATKILVDRVPAGLGSIDNSPAVTLCSTKRILSSTRYIDKAGRPALFCLSSFQGVDFHGN